MTSLLDDLLSLAGKATPGPWQRVDYDSDASDPDKRVCEMLTHGDIYAKKKFELAQNEHNGAFIVKANPKNITNICIALKKAEMALYRIKIEVASLDTAINVSKEALADIQKLLGSHDK